MFFNNSVSRFAFYACFHIQEADIQAHTEMLIFICKLAGVARSAFICNVEVDITDDFPVLHQVRLAKLLSQYVVRGDFWVLTFTGSCWTAKYHPPVRLVGGGIASL